MISKGIIVGDPFLFRKVLKFLLPKKTGDKIKKNIFNKTDKPRLLDDTKQQLKQFFKKDVTELSQILNKDFSKWIK